MKVLNLLILTIISNSWGFSNSLTAINPMVDTVITLTSAVESPSSILKNSSLLSQNLLNSANYKWASTLPNYQNNLVSNLPIDVDPEKKKIVKKGTKIAKFSIYSTLSVALFNMALKADMDYEVPKFIIGFMGFIFCAGMATQQLQKGYDYSQLTYDQAFGPIKKITLKDNSEVVGRVLPSSNGQLTRLRLIDGYTVLIPQNQITVVEKR